MLKKILLLTDVPPCKEFSGALLTLSLTEFLPQGSIVCVSILPSSLNYLKDSKKIYPFPITFLEKPREYAFPVKSKRLNTLINYTKEQYIHKIIIPGIIDRIVKLAKEHEVSKIWCILQGQTMIRIALKVSDHLNIPLHTQLWDHPQWWFKEIKIDPYTSRKVLKLFEETIEKSVMCGTASFEMSRQISSLQPNNIPLIASLDKKIYKPSALNQNRNTIRIGIVGQLYASTEWIALINALESIDWKFNHKDIVIRYLGYSNFAKDKKKVYVEFLGYRSQEETIKLMSKCDVLYCPYFFDKEFEIIARTSFPSKLTTYLAAGRPVFFHGPSYSSPSIFLKENNAAIFCHSLDKEEILKVLHEILTNAELVQLLVENGKNAFFEYLTTEKLKENFAAFLQVNQTDLL